MTSELCLSVHFAELPLLPTETGVYLFYQAGTPIYIGKAKNIRARISQHFNSDGKSAYFTSQADQFEYILTANELEALILEANLIKHHRPQYNVLLKDDKHYPFLKLTNEPFPILTITRRVLKDGAFYYGPYPDSSAVRHVKQLIDSLFPLRKNSGIPLKKKARPCLNYHMNRCLAPCINAADPHTYAAVVHQVRAFLEGKSELIIQQLQAEMNLRAQHQEFEQAAKIRDQLQAIQKLFGQEQKALIGSEINLDFLGLAVAGNYAMIQLFRMREGRIINRDKRLLTGEHASNSEFIAAFVQDYYTNATHVPPLILLPEQFEDAAQWSLFLSQRFSQSITMKTPKRGHKKELIDFAQKNAAISLETELDLLERQGHSPAQEALVQLLSLPATPLRIEGYDNSNLFGTHIVSGMVVYENGRMQKSEYRRFRVKGLSHPDDYAAMHQTILRRFTGQLAQQLPLPDLLLIDGGIGQVHAAIDALSSAEIQIPVVGLAKRFETLILPSEKGACWWIDRAHTKEIQLPHTDPALRLLIGIRDEVHRYSLQYHRHLRKKGMFSSIFDDLPLIGPRRKAVLIEHFSSLQDLAQASVEEIAVLPTMNKHVAVQLKNHLDATMQS